MNNAKQHLLELAESARLKSGELATLTELIDEATVDYQASADCPNYINQRTLGVLMATAHQSTESLNHINEALADELADYLPREGMK